ncbi:MAG TPA: PEP-CTERM sorting domain-containing protein, partial [Phycisphaerae bacterium]|nr:PEP-CTERM sorting domain-containing protein [Phycisphaerae bacterium]
LCVALAARAASAQTWHEYNDGGGEAGELISTAQWTVGGGTLTAIVGYDGGQDADLFAIYIANPSTFSATLTSSMSTQLWMFDSNGNGLAHTHSGAIPTLTGQFLPGPGLYYIGQSRDGWAANGPGGAIWAYLPAGVEKPPDGPGAPGPLTGWSGATHHAFEAYQINLQGAAYAPEPASLTLLGTGAALVLRRRRGGAGGTADARWRRR